MTNRYESINTYLNRSIIEASMNFAKMHQTSFCLAKFGFEVDLEDGYFFKDLMTFMYAELGFNPLLQQSNDTFIIILKDHKIHQAKRLLKQVEHSIKQHFKFELKNIGITLYDPSDTYKALLDRLDKYYIMSKLSTRKKIFYGTLDFDFYETPNRNDILASILKKEKSITLHNLYNGIPIQEDALLAHIDEGVVQLTVNSPKIHYYTKESFTFLQHDKIPSIIKGKILKVDPAKSLLVLTGLEFLDASPLDRSHIRVQPLKPINVSVKHNQIKLFDGSIDNLSEGSLVLQVKMADVEKLLQRTLLEEEFELAFQLPTEKGFLTIVHTKASIFSLINETLIFNIQPNSLVQSKIRQYIAMRQTTLLMDLKKQLKYMV